MADLTQQLAQMGALLAITGIPSTTNAGQPLHASLEPALSILSYVDIEEQDFTLDFIAKDVVFSNKNFSSSNFLEDANIAKVFPLYDLAAAVPVVDNSGVPGLIGKLKGKLPVAIPKTTAPRITVQWSITDDSNAPLAEGTEFSAPGGLSNPTLDIIFFPAFERFDGSIPAPTARQIRATVTLTADTASSTRMIGPLRVVIPTVPFPKVLALSLHTNFQGPALVVVPGTSAINNINHIKNLLHSVRNVISTLTSVARFAEMLTGIELMASVLEASNIEFKKSDTINNLNDITLVRRSLLENDTEAEDDISSLVYIAPPPPQRNSDNLVEFCNARDLDIGEGKFTIGTGISFVVYINNLHFAHPSILPSNATININKPPTGWRWFHNITVFGDEISSLNFL